MSKPTQDHAARIAAAESATAAQLADALDAYRAAGAVELGGGGPERLNWPATVQYLIDNPPWSSYRADSPAAKLRALWSEFPLDTPYGDVTAQIQRSADVTHDGEFYGRSFFLFVPRGGSFVINGAQYAPEENAPVTGTTINVERVREAWRINHNSFGSRELTDAAKRRLSEWLDAEGAALIFTPARVAARDLFDAATGANRAREKRDEAHALAIAADADWNKAADGATDALAAAVKLSNGTA